MTVEQLKRMRDVRPFEPFAIHTADGRQFPVMHPENMILSRSGRTLTVENIDGLSEVLDTLLVVSLRPMNQYECRMNRRRG
jgi:hypothetical protein